MSSEQSTASIRLEIQKIKNLPPLPMVAQQLLGVINNENASIDDIVKIIQQDPSLTSRILGLANSAFFGFGRKVLTLDEAIINVLGLDLVRGLGMAMVMGGVFDVCKCEEFNLQYYWNSSLMTAQMAKRCASLIKTENEINANQLYLYGLLHNLGVLVLVDRFPQLMTEIFIVAKKHAERRLIYTEQAMLDMDHHQAGAWLAHKWQLPSEVISVIRHHHYPDFRGEHWQEALITGYCSRTARNWIRNVDVLLPEEDDEILSILGINRKNMEMVAEKCRDSYEEIQGVANQMAS